MYLDVLCLTCNNFFRIGTFNSEKFEFFKYRYEKPNSEGDTHNADLCWTL